MVWGGGAWDGQDNSRSSDGSGSWGARQSQPLARYSARENSLQTQHNADSDATGKVSLSTAFLSQACWLVSKHQACKLRGGHALGMQGSRPKGLPDRQGRHAT